MAGKNPQYIAGGTIQPSRIVKIDTGANNNFTVLQNAAATTLGVGISQQGSRDAPGLTGSATDAARAGQHIHIYGPGEQCLLMIGTGGVTQGDLIESDASGQGVTIGAGLGDHYYIGWALESALAGELARVYVHPGRVNL